MRLAQKARQYLKGQWLAAIAVQFFLAVAWMMVLLIELMIMRVTNLDVEKVVYASDLWSGQWKYGALMVGLLLLDWFLITPLKLGQAAFYWQITEGKEASISRLFSFFYKRYGSALHWRASLFCRRLLWAGLCYAPAALTVGYASVVRRNGSDAPVTDVTLLLCTVFSLLFLVGGLLVYQLLMLRYLPTAYILSMSEDKNTSKKLFHRASRLMRGHVSEAFGLCAGFAGWFLLCLLLLPFIYAAPLFQTTRALAARQYMGSETRKAEKPVYQAQHMATRKRRVQSES